MILRYSMHPDMGGPQSANDEAERPWPRVERPFVPDGMLSQVW
jgi:hypothetical protein